MSRKIFNKKGLFNLSVFSFGLQFSNALLLANMSSIYKFLGATSGSLPYLWLAAPVSGLFIQPLVGQMSDRTCSQFGRRRPYILGWGIAAAIGICLLPLSPNLLLAAILLWIMDFSINGSAQALRALVGDLIPNKQKAQAFALQTIFSGVGAGVGTLMPYIVKNVLSIPDNILHFNKIPYSLQLPFFVGGTMLVICMLWTLYTIKEKPTVHVIWIGHIRRGQPKSLFARIRSFIHETGIDIKNLPPVIKEFIPAQFFTWIGLFVMWLYFSLSLAQHLYGLPSDANVVTNAYYAATLEKATIKASVYFSIYQWVSAAYAIFVPFFARKLSLKLLYAIALIIGASSLLITSIARDEIILIACMVGIGIMWGSIMTLPYAIISAKLPKSKMGVYLGIFNITVTLPQIIAGFMLRPIHIYILNNHATYTIMFGGAMILIGGLIILRSSITQSIRENLRICCKFFSPNNHL